jgi:hypothetical protein
MDREQCRGIFWDDLSHRTRVCPWCRNYRKCSLQGMTGGKVRNAIIKIVATIASILVPEAGLKAYNNSYRICRNCGAICQFGEWIDIISSGELYVVHNSYCKDCYDVVMQQEVFSRLTGSGRDYRQSRWSRRSKIE